VHSHHFLCIHTIINVHRRFPVYSAIWYRIHTTGYLHDIYLHLPTSPNTLLRRTLFKLDKCTEPVIKYSVAYTHTHTLCHTTWDCITSISLNFWHNVPTSISNLDLLINSPSWNYPWYLNTCDILLQLIPVVATTLGISWLGADYFIHPSLRGVATDRPYNFFIRASPSTQFSDHG
jgi:hypothetical protein